MSARDQEILNKLGLKVSEFARLAGVSRQYASKVIKKEDAHFITPALLQRAYFRASMEIAERIDRLAKRYFPEEYPLYFDTDSESYQSPFLSNLARTAEGRELIQAAKKALVSESSLERYIQEHFPVIVQRLLRE